MTYLNSSRNWAILVEQKLEALASECADPQKARPRASGPWTPAGRVRVSEGKWTYLHSNMPVPRDFGQADVGLPQFTVPGGNEEDVCSPVSATMLAGSQDCDDGTGKGSIDALSHPGLV